MKKTLAALALGTLTLAASDMTPSRGILKHREHNGIGYDTGYTTAEVFLAPQWKNNILPFADFRGHVFDDGRFATNAGLGLRYDLSGYTIGGNFYYDFREAKNINPHQLAGGLELLSKYFDVRINGYGPITATKTERPAQFDGFSGHSAFFKRRLKAALPVLEGEIGAPLGSRCGIANFYAALGPYYLFSKRVNGCRLGDAVGGKGRLNLDIINRFNATFDTTYDKIFKWTFQGTVGVTIPFSRRQRLKDYKNFICAARNQLPHRVEIIPVECKTKRVRSSSNIIFVDNTSSSDGTFESPYPTTAMAINNSAPGDIIYIFPGDGTTTGYNTALTLLPNQTIQGSSAPLDLGGGLIVPPQTSGQMPRLTSPSNTITLARNTTVRGLNITATTAAIRQNDPTTPVGGITRIEQNTLHNCPTGMNIGNDSNSVTYLVASNFMTQCTTQAILINGAGTTSNTLQAFVFDNTMQNMTGDGINLTPQDSTRFGCALVNNRVDTVNRGLSITVSSGSPITEFIETRGIIRNTSNTSHSLSTANSSVMTAFISNSQIGPVVQGNTHDAFSIAGSGSSSLTLTALNNDISDTGTPGRGIIAIFSSNTSSKDFTFKKNRLHGTGLAAQIENITATNFSVVFDNNFVFDASDGFIDSGGASVTNNYNYTTRNNIFSNTGNFAISLESNTPSSMRAILQNNLSFNSSTNAIRLDGGGGNICATVTSNQAPGQNLRLIQSGAGVVSVESPTPGSSSGLLEVNDFNAVTTSGTVNFVAPGTCD